LPADFIRLTNELLLARRTWQLFGISHKDLMAMDPYDVEMMKIALVIDG